MKKITPCLWFDNQAEEAATFYTSIFPDSQITAITRYTQVGREIHGREEGAVMTVEFEINGQPFTALNGGPMFRFSEAISFQVRCQGQEEIDDYWEKLGAGGDPQAQQCGWLKDRFAVSWQIVPAEMVQLLQGDDPTRKERVMSALLGMKKLDITKLRMAHAG
jgi:predicted 3-demethylubiquinone-9 3-methyltransferase (glyoxalase superfamily)